MSATAIIAMLFSAAIIGGLMWYLSNLPTADEKETRQS